MTIQIRLVDLVDAEKISDLPYFKELWGKQFLCSKKDLYTEAQNKAWKERDVYLRTFREKTGFGFIASSEGKDIGYSYGYANDNNTFYVQGSAVAKEFQGQGIYKKLAMKIIEEARNRHYSFVCSEHILTDNQVIVPKLKMGYIVTGQNVTFNRGVFLELTYPLTEELRHSINIRSGLEKPNQDLVNIYKLTEK